MTTRKVVRKVKAKLVTCMVNGQIASVASMPNTATLKALVARVGTAHGLKGATLKINGARIAQPDLNRTLAQYKARTVELVSKDTRG